MASRLYPRKLIRQVQYLYSAYIRERYYFHLLRRCFQCIIKFYKTRYAMPVLRVPRSTATLTMESTTLVPLEWYIFVRACEPVHPKWKKNHGSLDAYPKWMESTDRCPWETIHTNRSFSFLLHTENNNASYGIWKILYSNIAASLWN